MLHSLHSNWPTKLKMQCDLKHSNVVDMCKIESLSICVDQEGTLQTDDQKGDESTSVALMYTCVCTLYGFS